MDSTLNAGRVAGGLLAPITGAGAVLRRSRFLHPRGVVYLADVRPLLHDGRMARLAERLSGPALVRLSGAWWKRREWVDVLGCAVRFRSTEEVSPTPAAGDQDLLFATIRSPWTTLLAAFTTHFHDFLENDFYAVSPFEVAGLGEARFRLVGPRGRRPGKSREERLEEAVRRHEAALRIECRTARLLTPWIPLAELRLRQHVAIDQEALSFSPFRSGRGIRPTGFVHGLRSATYALGQLGRHAVNP